VLAIEARWRDGRVVTLHNLSAEPAAVRLPDDLDERAQTKTKEVRQVLGDAEPPYSTGQEIALSGYGFRWLRVLD
jgi:hypothetical protein